MELNELQNWIYEMHRQGLDDAQIAGKLGVTIDVLESMLNGEVKPLDPKAKTVRPVKSAVEASESVSEEVAENVTEKCENKHKKHSKPVYEDDSWMD